MFAIRNHNDIDVITYLCKVTKDINKQTSKDEPKYPGFTALHFAAGEKLPAHAAILITHGAKTDIVNEDGFTALQLADEKTKTAMISSSFARFSMQSPPPVATQPTARRATLQPDSHASLKLRAGPLRRTSMLATLSSSVPVSAPISTTPPLINEVKEEDEDKLDD